MTGSGDEQGWGPAHALLPGPPVAPGAGPPGPVGFGPVGSGPVGAPGPPPERGTWALSRRGLSTVIRLELRQRVRSSRWLLMLGIWFATIAVIFGLTLAVIGGSEDAGAYLFGAIAFLVLTLGMLVAPALSATSINGDRSAGTLAAMQMTLLSPAEIAVGKLLAAWGTALVFLAVGSPFLLVSLALGGTSLPRAVVTLLMLSLILLTVCGIALGWSALTARLASSAVLTYLSVAFLCLGTLVFFGLSVPLVQTEDEVEVLTTPQDHDFSSSDPLPRSECDVVTAVRSRTHTEYTWWMLAANPYVVVADAAPRNPDSEDVLSLIGLGARTARDGAQGPVDECFAAAPTSDELVDEPTSGPVWPIGLALNLVLGGLGLTAAVLRLRTPVGALPRGTRIA